MQLTGPEAWKKVERLVKSGWTQPEIAARLALKSTSAFYKWKEGHSPLAGTSAALKRLKCRSGAGK